jgi:hypothetical protein
MNIYIFTDKEAAIKKHFPKNARYLSVSDLSKHSPNGDDLSYLDVTGFKKGAALKKIIVQLLKSCRKSPWGIVDPKGNVKDISLLFIEGASDYFGPAFFKGSGKIDPKRLKEAHLWRKAFVTANAALGKASADSSGEAEGSSIFKTGIKFPPESSFPGWKKMETGKTMPFFILYCSLKGKTPLDTRLDDKTINQIYQKFLNILDNDFYEGDGLLWMNTGRDCLFLLPPRVKSVDSVIKACMKMIVSAPMISTESLGIPVPTNFVFVLHYGSVSYKPPGKTGTVVSDAINFIFHLGTKKAQAGRLTISSEVPDKTIPLPLQDCFVPAGEFEGRKIWHSRKFSYAKLWV